MHTAVQRLAEPPNRVVAGGGQRVSRIVRRLHICECRRALAAVRAAQPFIWGSLRLCARMRTAAALVAVLAVISYLDHAQQDRTHGAWLVGEGHYSTYGDRGKPPLVIIPGLDGCTVFFAHVLLELVRDFFVVVYDLPLYSGQNYTFSYIAEDVVSALDAEDIERASIVGESFGGVVAQHVALEHSERVEALVLLSSLAKTELTPVVRFKLRFMLPVVELLGRAFPGIAQTIFAKVHASDVVESSEPAWVRSLFVKEASWAHHASVMQRIKIVAALDIEDRVPSITQPVLLVRGADDSFTGHTTARLRALLQSRGQVGTFPDGAVDVVTLPGGHLPHVTSSDLFARAVRDALFVVQVERKEMITDAEWRELKNKNPFYNTTDVDIALTSAGYVSWRAVEELKK